MFFRIKFISKEEWPPKSPDCNPLDYYFWNAVSTKVYENRREPFANLEQLKRKIKSVWPVVINMEHIQKAIMEFRPRLKEHFG